MIERPPDVLKDRLDPGERLLWWDAPPRAIHPLVCPKPDNGQLVLNLSPWYAVEIEGMEREESDALLHYLSDRMQSSTRPLIHRWRH